MVGLINRLSIYSPKVLGLWLVVVVEPHVLYQKEKEKKNAPDISISFLFLPFLSSQTCRSGTNNSKSKFKWCGLNFISVIRVRNSEACWNIISIRTKRKRRKKNNIINFSLFRTQFLWHTQSWDFHCLETKTTYKHKFQYYIFFYFYLFLIYSATKHRDIIYLPH